MPEVLLKKTFNERKILYKDFVVEFYRCEGREIYGKKHWALFSQDK